MRYQERVAPSIWMYAAGAFIIPAVILVFLPVNVTVGAILGWALFGGYIAFLRSCSPVIEITSTTLRVGAAKIPLRFVGTATAYSTRQSAREAAGPGLDARAWISLRGWVKTSVRVDITDERDPIPYWLFSTRNPKELSAELNKAVTQLHR